MIYVNLAKKERLEVVDRLKKLGFKEELNEETSFEIYSKVKKKVKTTNKKMLEYFFDW